MALFTPSASPAVTVKEIDLTGVVPNVQTSTGAFVGNFGWGPVGQATLVSDESGLVTVFSAPTTANTVDFHSAAYFLRYSNSLQVVREVDSDSKNSIGKNANATTTPPIYGNLDVFEGATIDSGDGAFIAKYPGELGDSIKVSICAVSDSDNGGTNNFNSWTYKDKFDAAPSTSSYVSSVGGSNDEIHVAVIDATGDITGTPNTVLETFPFLSVASNAKTDDGTTNYFKDVLKVKSQWIYAGEFHRSGDSDAVNDLSGANWGNPVTAVGTEDFKGDVTFGIGTNEWQFDGGVTSSSLGTDDVLRGFDKFEDKEAIEVDFLIAPDSISDISARTIVNDLVSTAGSLRKDCVVVASPSRNAVTVTGTTAAVTTCNNGYTKSSYLIQDNNFLKVFDKYNDQYIKIPANSSTAGLMAATDLVAAPWYSPAGSRRGRYLGITDIVLSPSKSDRDTLYKAGINPISNLPGQGIMLFGDKTNMSRPSAFDRINVRRLFLAIERAISIAGRGVMFEFNDEFTRAEFVNIVEPFLREIKGRRGITDFRVVCDSTNNTAAVVDRNEFIASIFIKPARSINYVTLNFVAVRTGVEFEEVVGTV
jgi:hypothetical protein|tara:strand:+ start:1163 stop:2938 length:1776 start_codon:yes stop_codon:yes gene_type:complete